MLRLGLALCIVFSDFANVLAQDAPTGLRGDPAAIAEAQAMVEAMGGREIWSQVESLHFVHRWFL